ncbi:hypothetical protein AAC387_Pa03g4129 [Persea americana]
MPDPELNSRLRMQIALNLVAALGAGAYYMTYMRKKPRRTSSVSGATYVNEVLQGHHPTPCREVCRMELSVFRKLCDIVREEGLLQNTAGVNVDEQLMMFLFTIGQNVSNRQVQKRFQHSGETVSRHFNNVLNALTELSPHYIHLPPLTTPPVIHDRRFFPYFKGCLGAIGGTHIPITVDTENHPPYQNNQGFLSQNIMAACSFDLRFLYVLAGWEGSATNSMVFQAALDSGFEIPEGKYYLADLDYANMPGLICPYRGIRYHPKEFARGREAPRNEKELFNLRHSSLRNAIERAFGVLKKRFQILKVAPLYPIDSQIKMVLVACTLHNFLRIETGGEDWLYAEYDSEAPYHPIPTDDLIEAQVFDEMRAPNAADALRDRIAKEMWRDYCNRR